MHAIFKSFKFCALSFTLISGPKDTLLPTPNSKLPTLSFTLLHQISRFHLKRLSKLKKGCQIYVYFCVFDIAYVAGAYLVLLCKQYLYKEGFSEIDLAAAKNSSAVFNTVSAPSFVKLP